MTTLNSASDVRVRRWLTFTLCVPLLACNGSGVPEGIGATAPGLVSSDTDSQGATGSTCGPEVETTTIPMPAGVLRPRTSGFVPDAASGVLFQYTDATTNRTEIGYILTDGSGFRCISCNAAFDAVPDFVPGQAFPDGKRFIVQSGENDTMGQLAYYVAACAPSIAACDNVTIRPIEGFPGGIKLQDRVPKLSPDGSTFVWTRIRPDGYFMLAAPIVQGAKSYTIGEARVLNPPAPSGSGDAGALSVASAWYEAKSVSHDGTTLAFAGTLGDSMNLDWFLMDLASGSVLRLTRDADWDEGGQLFPGGRYMTGGRSRGGNVLASLAALPRPPLFDYAVIGAITNYYLPRGNALPALRPKRSRLVPHLLDLNCTDTENGATTVGDHDEGWIGDGGGGNTWSRDGQRFVNGERREDDPNTTRLRVGMIQGAPANVDPPSPMVIPAWAPRLADLPSPLSPTVQQQTLQGPHGGTATISFMGDMLAGEFIVQYTGYSSDGCSTLDGVQRAIVASPLVAHYRESLMLSGCENGTSDVDVVFADAATHGHAQGERNGVSYERSFGCSSP
ncbi:hypothetical protein [Polyangium sp. y55x31]|uniref:hypothetical protein n=1 Tax=Polyangium sp. y55x31 TaxID=3042688 RepID=UPI00248219A4|nr:hypothetical protein [Polyangium sp. y55x31]MDI1479567.1 hypothetical protein [Polyangium sp. y55x31]